MPRTIRYSSEEVCRAIHRFTRKCKRHVEEFVIDQDSVFITREVFGEAFETATFKAFLEEQDMRLWVCRKADPESKGCVENSVGYVKKRFFSERKFGHDRRGPEGACRRGPSAPITASTRAPST